MGETRQSRKNAGKWVARNKNSVSIKKRRGREGKKGIEKEIGGKGKGGKESRESCPIKRKRLACLVSSL